MAPRSAAEEEDLTSSWSKLKHGDDFRTYSKRPLCSMRWTLDAPLAHRHRGEMVHGVVPIHAEVANLDRSIVFTGPPLHWREVEKPIRGGQGITTVQAGGGLMVMEWARVERCGRVALGQYCVHLHLVGKCASCAVRGVVVDGGVNKGITIHGTHDATGKGGDPNVLCMLTVMGSAPGAARKQVANALDSSAAGAAARASVELADALPQLFSFRTSTARKTREACPFHGEHPEGSVDMARRR